MKDILGQGDPIVLYGPTDEAYGKIGRVVSISNRGFDKYDPIVTARIDTGLVDLPMSKVTLLRNRPVSSEREDRDTRWNLAIDLMEKLYPGQKPESMPPKFLNMMDRLVNRPRE